MPEILDRVIVEIIGDDSKLKHALNQAERSATQAASKIEGAFARAVGPSTRLLGSVTVLGGALSALGLKAVGMAGDMEQARIGLTTMLGSADAADKHLRKLYDFAAKTPFEINGLIDADRRLMAMGFRADEVIPTLTAIGDAVAAVGGSAELLDRVTLALGQMRAKGKVSGEEMRQLAEAGIPAWEMLADAIGTDIPTAMKMAEQGTINAATGIEAILGGMEQRFAGSMEAQSRTIMGMWSNVKDNLTRSMIALGEEITDALDIRSVLQTSLQALERFRAWLEAGGLRKWWKEYKNTLIVVAGAITAALIPAITALTTALWGMVAPLTPFLAAGAALTGAFVLMGGTMDDVRVIAKTLGTAFSGLWDILVGLGKGSLAIVRSMHDAWQRYIEGMGRSMALLGDAMQATLAGDFGRAAQLVDTAALAAKTAWAGGMRVMQEATAEASARTGEGITKLADVVTGRVGASFEGAKSTAQDAADTIASGFGVKVPAATVKTGQSIKTNVTQPLKTATEQAVKLGEAMATMYGGSQRYYSHLGNAGATVAPRGAPGIAGGARLDYGLADFDTTAREAAQDIADSWHMHLDTAAREAGQSLEDAARAQRAAVSAIADMYHRAAYSMTAGGINRIGLTPEPVYNTISGSGSSQYGGTQPGAGLGNAGATVAPREGSDIAGGAPLYDNLADFDQAAREAAHATEQLTQTQQRHREAEQQLMGGMLNTLNALNPLGAILEAINPLGTAIQGMLKELEPVLKPIISIFADIGKMVGQVLAPALKLITPVIQWFGNVLSAVARFVAGVWNAIARGLNAVLGWLGVNIPTIDLAGGKDSGAGDPTPEPAWSGWGDTTNTVATVGIAAAPAPVTATPGWVHTFGGHVDRFGHYVARLVEEGITVRIGGIGGQSPTAEILANLVGGAV